MVTAIDKLISQGGPGRLCAGFDTGSGKNLGWALVCPDGSLHSSGWWNVGSYEEDLEIRLERVASYAVEFFRKWGEEILAVGIERPWIGPNRQTGLTLAWVAGTLFGISCAFGKQPMRIQPREAKKAFTDDSKATKETVLRIARVIAKEVGLEVETEDEADAIAVATAVRLRVIEEAMR